MNEIVQFLEEILTKIRVKEEEHERHSHLCSAKAEVSSVNSATKKCLKDCQMEFDFLEAASTEPMCDDDENERRKIIVPNIKAEPSKLRCESDGASETEPVYDHDVNEKQNIMFPNSETELSKLHCESDGAASTEPMYDDDVNKKQNIIVPNTEAEPSKLRCESYGASETEPVYGYDVDEKQSIMFPNSETELSKLHCESDDASETEPVYGYDVDEKQSIMFPNSETELSKLHCESDDASETEPVYGYDVDEKQSIMFPNSETELSKLHCESDDASETEPVYGYDVDEKQSIMFPNSETELSKLHCESDDASETEPVYGYDVDEKQSIMFPNSETELSKLHCESDDASETEPVYGYDVDEKQSIMFPNSETELSKLHCESDDASETEPVYGYDVDEKQSIMFPNSETELSKLHCESDDASETEPVYGYDVDEKQSIMFPNSETELSKLHCESDDEKTSIKETIQGLLEDVVSEIHENEKKYEHDSDLRSTPAEVSYEKESENEFYLLSTLAEVSCIHSAIENNKKEFGNEFDLPSAQAKVSCENTHEKEFETQFDSLESPPTEPICADINEDLNIIVPTIEKYVSNLRCESNGGPSTETIYCQRGETKNLYIPYIEDVPVNLLCQSNYASDIPSCSTKAPPQFTGMCFIQASMHFVPFPILKLMNKQPDPPQQNDDDDEIQVVYDSKDERVQKAAVEESVPVSADANDDTIILGSSESEEERAVSFSQTFVEHTTPIYPDNSTTSVLYRTESEAGSSAPSYTEDTSSVCPIESEFSGKSKEDQMESSAVPCESGHIGDCLVNTEDKQKRQISSMEKRRVLANDGKDANRRKNNLLNEENFRTAGANAFTLFSTNGKSICKNNTSTSKKQNIEKKDSGNDREIPEVGQMMRESLLHEEETQPPDNEDNFIPGKKEDFQLRLTEETVSCNRAYHDDNRKRLGSSMLGGEEDIQKKLKNKKMKGETTTSGTTAVKNCV